MHCLLLFAALLGLQPPPQASAGALANLSSFVFRGRIVKAAAATMPQVKANRLTAVVLVEEVYKAGDAIRNVNGMSITVALKQPAVEGRSYIFFTNVVLYGTSLAARESGRLAATQDRESARKAVDAAFQEKDDRLLGQRIARAQLVVAGKVLRTQAMRQGLSRLCRALANLSVLSVYRNEKIGLSPERVGYREVGESTTTFESRT